MKMQNIVIDINRLTAEQLRELAAMTYCNGDTETTQQINNRVAFLEGWMSEKKSAEYVEKFC